MSTCTLCHAEMEAVHRKVIKGELWEKEAHVLPACVDCHQPHKVRKVFYDQGMADRDCMRCHDDPDLKSSKDGRSLQVHGADLVGSRHVTTACSKCHTGVTASRERPCETITRKVDCTSCHEEVGQQYQASAHGRLFAKADPNAPSCKECHGEKGLRAGDGRPMFVDAKEHQASRHVKVSCSQCHSGVNVSRRRPSKKSPYNLRYSIYLCHQAAVISFSMRRASSGL